MQLIVRSGGGVFEIRLPRPAPGDAGVSTGFDPRTGEEFVYGVVDVEGLNNAITEGRKHTGSPVELKEGGYRG